jgi:5-methyltetrahydrofolate--homocysteine methyltransferase
MANTLITSASKEVIIGFDQPFVVIGERINTTGPQLRAAGDCCSDATVA